VAFHDFLDSVGVAVAARCHQDLAGFEWDAVEFLTLSKRPVCDGVAQEATEHRPSQTGRYAEREDAAQPDDAAWNQGDRGDCQPGEVTDDGACSHADLCVMDDVGLGVALERTVRCLPNGKPQTVAAQPELPQIIDRGLGAVAVGEHCGDVVVASVGPHLVVGDDVLA